jgi:hypothetical protein
MQREKIPTKRAFLPTRDARRGPDDVRLERIRGVDEARHLPTHRA